MALLDIRTENDVVDRRLSVVLYGELQYDNVIDLHPMGA